MAAIGTLVKQAREGGEFWLVSFATVDLFGKLVEVDSRFPAYQGK